MKAEAKKLVLEKFYKWIQVFSKKSSEQMSTRKLWDHAIDVKEQFILKKGKVYLLLREEREEVCKFISEQLRKGYIRPSKPPQTASVFFVGKKDGITISISGLKNDGPQFHFIFFSIFILFSIYFHFFYF